MVYGGCLQCVFVYFFPTTSSDLFFYGNFCGKFSHSNMMNKDVLKKSALFMLNMFHAQITREMKKIESFKAKKKNK